MKFTTAVLPFVLLAGRAIAAQSQQTLAKQPPGCLLHAVNTQDEPRDMNSVCGSNAKVVQQAIASMCSDNVASQAQAAFIATCSGAGKTVAAYTASSSNSGTAAVTTDSQGHTVTKTSAAGSAATSNAAAVMVHKASTGYAVVVVAFAAVVAL